jgi:hypothetical protein
MTVAMAFKIEIRSGLCGCTLKAANAIRADCLL